MYRDEEKGNDILKLYFLVDASVPKNLNLGDEHDSFMWVDNKGEIPKTDIDPGSERTLRQVFEGK